MAWDKETIIEEVLKTSAQELKASEKLEAAATAIAQAFDVSVQELKTLKTSLETGAAAMPEGNSEFDRLVKGTYGNAIRNVNVALAQLADGAYASAVQTLRDLEFSDFGKVFISSLADFEREKLQQPDFRREAQTQFIQHWNEIDAKLESIQQMISKAGRPVRVIRELGLLKERFDDIKGLRLKTGDPLDTIELKGYEGVSSITAKAIEQVALSNPAAPGTLQVLLAGCQALASTFDAIAMAQPESAGPLRSRERTWGAYRKVVKAIQEKM